MKMDGELGARWLVLGVDGGRRRMKPGVGEDVLNFLVGEAGVLVVEEGEWIAVLVGLELMAH